MSDAAPPGWYPDGRGGQRYWDGGRWLEAPPAGPPPAGPPPVGPPTSGPPPSGAGPGPRSWADAAYTPPPGPPPRKSRAALWAVLGVVGVLLVAALVTTLVLVTGDDGGDEQADDATSQSAQPEDDPTPDDPDTTEPTEEPEGDPAETVQAFIDAALDGDCAALEDLVTDDFLDESGDCSSADFDTSELEGVELEVGDTEVDGDTATVQLVSTYEGQTAEIGLELVYEDGAWLIDGTDLPDTPEPPSASAPTLPSPS